MSYGAISSKDLFSHENPSGRFDAAYGLAMLALKSPTAPVEDRLQALEALFRRTGYDANKVLALPNRSEALSTLAEKAGIRLTITPGIVEGFSNLLSLLVQRNVSGIEGEIAHKHSEISSLNQRFSETVVARLLD